MTRTIRQLHAISSLVKAKFVSDGWILSRTMMERYLLFQYLCNTGEFELFDDWCFKKKYDHLNRIKSIRAFKDKPEMQNRKFQDDEMSRYKQVCKDKWVIDWRRPDLEEIARSIDMKFLYDAYFDWASGYVHPTSHDGLDDYWIMMEKVPDNYKSDKKTLLNNSILVTVLHIQLFLNEPEYNWRKVLYDLLDEFMKALGLDDHQYEEVLRKVIYCYESKQGLLLPIQ